MNSKFLDLTRKQWIGLGLVGFGGWWAASAAGVELPVLPEWTELAAAGAVAVILIGYWAGGKIYDMLPEQHGIFLICFDSDDDAGGEVWELSDDQFDSMEVHNGRLLQWESAKRVYECRSYNRDRNKAVGNWRETAAGSELAAEHKPTQVMRKIRILRDEFETEAERAKALRNRFPAIIRRLDRERAKDQARSLEPHLTPSADRSAGVSQIIEESLPDHLQPDGMSGDEAADRAADDGDGWQSFELLDDVEPLEDTGPNQAVADD